MQQVGFIGPGYTLRSVNVDCQRTVNLFPQLNELGTGKNREIAALVRTPGLVRLATLGVGPSRAMHAASNGRSFALSGDKLYEISTPSSPILRGTIATGTGTASIADNGVQLIVVDGDKGYILTFATNVFAQITDAEFPNGATRVDFQDGYFISHRVNTREFWLSALYDGASWDGLDFAAKEGQPDNLVGFAVCNRELYLFGERTTEVWFNSGAADFPFSRIDGAFIEYGIVSQRTVVKLAGALYAVGRNADGQGMVGRVSNYQAQRLSTFPVEQALTGYADLASASAWGYQDGAHAFYVLNVPSAGTTWVLDVVTGLWHERNYLKAEGGFTRHRAENHIFAGGKHIVGDFEDGRIYELSNTAYTDDGQPIKWLRAAPHISEQGKFLYYREFHLDMETGVGLTSGQGSDPQIFYRFSDDYGHTWSSERWASMGKRGNYRHRVVWRRLGRARDRVDEVSGTDPVSVTLISAFHDVEVAA